MPKLTHRLLILLLLTPLCLTSVGCGVYSTSSGRIDESIRQVAVPYFENMTAEPSIEVELTENIISALQDDNTLRVVDAQDAATELTGKVVRYTLREAFTTSELQVDEYQVQIMVELTLRILETGETLFEKKRITGTGNFAVEDTGDGETAARETAAAEIVREVLAAVVEDW